MRDGLGLDPLKAEQYVNTHTDPKKPSGRANLFYPATEPTGFEQGLTRKITDSRYQSTMKPDDGPPVQFASQSSHVLGDGEARKPTAVPEVANEINTAVTVVAPELAPITTPIGIGLNTYLLAVDPSWGRAADVALTARGAKVLEKAGLDKNSANRLSSVIQTEKSNYEKFKK